MFMLVLSVHIIVCFGLITIVLIQRGRGGGLVESFAGVESMFGTKTSTFLTKATTTMSILFFLTCIALAALSVRQSKSLMRNVRPVAAAPATAAAGAGRVPETKTETSAPAAADPIPTPDIPKAQ
jgi:preprotein translocase subunit SecG